MSPRLRSVSAILVAFAASLGVYVASLHGDVGFWDTGDLQTVPYILGIPYPTGFPGYVLLGWLWTHIFPFGNVAWRLNVFAALACAATAGAVVALLLTLGTGEIIAVAAAAVYAFGAVPWSHATYVDVHPIAFAAVAWSAVFAARWQRRGNWHDAIVSIVAAAVALACDNTTALALPGLLMIAWSRRPPLLPSLQLTALAFACVLAVYAYLPLRSAAVTAARADPTLALGLAPGRPFWDDGHPSSPAAFFRVVAGTDFSPHRALSMFLARDTIHGVAADFVPDELRDLGDIVPWLAVFGGVMLWWRQPLVLGGLLLFGLIPLLFGTAYPVESETTRYYLGAYFAIVAFAAYGANVVWAGLFGVQRVAGGAVALLALGFLLSADALAGTAFFDEAKNVDGTAWIARVVAQTPANAIVVAPWTYATPLAYGAYVEHALGTRIVLTGKAYEFQSHYRVWMRDHAIVIVSDEARTFAGYRVNELDSGSPHLYALR